MEEYDRVKKACNRLAPTTTNCDPEGRLERRLGDVVEVGGRGKARQQDGKGQIRRVLDEAWRIVAVLPRNQTILVARAAARAKEVASKRWVGPRMVADETAAKDGVSSEPAKNKNEGDELESACKERGIQYTACCTTVTRRMEGVALLSGNPVRVVCSTSFTNENELRGRVRRVGDERCGRVQSERVL
ncbi:hypothetical protein PC128_g22301 [Phytophthora cactorum]|nr:hypothetical protein PC128_g22301 [Phytophthora cactorum]